MGVKVVGVTQFNTTVPEAQAFIDEHALSFPNIFDEDADIADAYGVQGVPHYVYVDRQGRIAHETSGARGVQLIDAVLSQIAAEPG